MKKKLLTALLTVAVAGTCAGALAACDKGNDEVHHYSEKWSYNPENLDAGHWHKCTDEGCNQVSGIKGHKWEKGTETPATCTQAKQINYTCPDCGATKTETEGAKLGHTWGEWEITAENMPTENKDGKVTRTCTVDGCNAVDATAFTVPRLWIDGKINPVYKDWVLKNTADCEHEGTANYTYVNSEKQIHIEFTGKTPALGHDWNEALETVDDNYHRITCKRNAEHIKPDSTAAHTKKTTETASLKYNNQSGKWEHIYVTTCEDGCDYKKEFKGQEADLNDGGEGTTLTGASVGNGTYASPFIVAASNFTERTVTIPANTVVSLRYTNLGAMGIFAVTPVDSDNLSVIYGGRVEAVADGERAKSDPYYGERGASLDFGLTTTNGEAATVKFKFFDNDNYYMTGNPANVVVDTTYTDEVPEETDVRHTFTPAEDGVYKFTVTGGMVMLDMGRDGTSGGSEFSETLYEGRIYQLSVSAGIERNAASVTFKIKRMGEIPEPELGSADRPIEITEIGDYEVKIEPASWGVSGVYYAFTPSVSGLYTFFDENSNIATYNLHSESPTGDTLANSMNNSDRAYKYISCELEAGTTYYLGVSSTENKKQTVNMTITLHEHEFATGWTTDAKYHWHAATCGHTDRISGKGAHTYGANGKCTVCDMDKIEFNAQITVTDGTNTYDNVTVTAKLADGTVVASGATASGGVVTLALIPDDYVLELTGLPESYGYYQRYAVLNIVNEAVTLTITVYELADYALTVKLPDGTPANGITVKFNNVVAGEYTVTTENGVAKIKALPPMAVLSNGSLTNSLYTVTLPEDLGDYAYTGNAVTLNSNNKTAEITLAKLLAYTLTLKDENGVALNDITVKIMDGNSTVTTVTTNSEGIATTEKIVAGEYSLSLSNDYSTENKTSLTQATLNVTCKKIEATIDGGDKTAPAVLSGSCNVSQGNSAFYKFSGTGTFKIKVETLDTVNKQIYLAYLNGTATTNQILANGDTVKGAGVGNLEITAKDSDNKATEIQITLGSNEYIVLGLKGAGVSAVTITEVTE